MEKQTFEWTDHKVIDFVKWFLKIHMIPDRFEIENMEILWSFQRDDAPELWHTEGQKPADLCDPKIWRKADKWDDLVEEVGKFYPDDPDEEPKGDLGDIGEVCARKLGYLFQ